MDDTLIKVLLVDDHEMVRIGLAGVLGTRMALRLSGKRAMGMMAFALHKNIDRTSC